MKSRRESPALRSARRSTRILASVLSLAALAAAVAGAPSLARAQTDAETQQARAAFEEAVRLMQQQRFSDAIPLLERSRAIRETPPVVFNLGLAYRGTGDYGRATEALRRVVALTESSPRHAAMRTRALEILGELSSARAHLVIHVRGGATRVTLDGQAIGAGDGTFEHELDAGRHRLEVSRPGYEPVSRELEVHAGERATADIDAGERPRPATLRIAPDPPESDVRIDGALVGTGNVERELSPGRHAVEVSARGRRASRFEVSLQAGTTLVREVSLRPEPLSRRTDDGPRSSGGLLTRWWFWTAVGAVVAGGAVIAVVAAQPGTRPYEGGSLGMTVVALDR